MALYHLKKLGAVSFIFGMKYPVISLSIFDRLLEPVFFLPISCCLFTIN